MDERRLSRRALHGSAVVAAGAPLVAACGAEDPGPARGADGAGSNAPSSSAAPSGTTPATGDGTGSPEAGGTVLVGADGIPVGGGQVFVEHSVVLTRPAEGTYVAFDSRCTHRGCQVSRVEGDAIVCTCHGSRFAVADGAVLEGPAQRPLPPVEVVVADGRVVLPDRARGD